MARSEFSKKTKRLIADQAGQQCSFPTCCRRTVSADSIGPSTSGSGIAAHIYSASPGGPRGQAGLTNNELAQPENGIWLCSDHAKLVDNNRGAAFSPETLLSYKALQEARVIREVQGLFSPIGWIHEIEVRQSPLFAPEQTVSLAKVNLLLGENMSGKTALTEWIAGTFVHDHLDRWSPPQSGELSIRVSFLNPMPQQIAMTIAEDGERAFSIDGIAVPFNPVGLRILHLGPLQFERGASDVTLLSDALGLTEEIIRTLVREVNAFPHARVHNVRFDHEDGEETLYADVDGTVPGLPLANLSGRETERVFLEFVTAAARVSGRHHPTLVILDGCPSILFEGFFEYYSHHFLDPENQFQTIMCVPSQKLDLDAVRWNGWEVIRTAGKPPDIRLTQELRVPKPA